MKVATLVGLALGISSSTAVLSADAKTAPVAGLTIQRAEAAFGIAVGFACLTAQERGVAIADLPADYRGDLVSAGQDDVQAVPKSWKGRPVWISHTLGGLLRIGEVAPDRCEVIAERLPVDETLKKTAEFTERLTPPFNPITVKGGYNPIAYQTERVQDGKRIVIHLEGAEPGGFNHAYRFSLLYATIISQPESAKPPYR